MPREGVQARIHEGRAADIAIIGGGAGAREFIIRFLEAGGIGLPTRFVIFEPRATIGRGIAWSDNLTPFLANMRIETLGPTYHEFDLIQKLLQQVGDPDGDLEYPSRRAVGRALDHRWQQKLDQLMGGKDPTTHVRETAIAIDWDAKSQSASVRCGDGSCHAGFNLVVLALGNIPTKCPPNLAGASVIGGWDFAAIGAVPPASDVLIKGSGLTAIDATMHLLENGHSDNNRSIVWHSRSGALPFIRPKQIRLNAAMFNYQSLSLIIDSLRKQGKDLTLNRLLWLFELEMRNQTNENKGQFAPFTDLQGFRRCLNVCRDPSNGRDQIKEGIIGAGSQSLWFSVAKLLDEYTIPLIWNALPDAEKAQFLMTWRRDFDRFWAPIPVVNGQRIDEWLTKGTIQLLRTQINYEWDARTRKFLWDDRLEDPLGEVQKDALRSRYQAGFDVLIDAGGIASDLDILDSPLVADLLHKGLLTKYVLETDVTPAGETRKMSLGAKIDWATGALLNDNGEPHGWLYTLAGSLTVGAHRFTNSYLAVAASADRTAKHLFL